MIKTKKHGLDKVNGTNGDFAGRHKQVYAYLGKNLSDEETKIFAEHLADCSKCLDTVIEWHYENVMDEVTMSLSSATAKEDEWVWLEKKPQPEPQVETGDNRSATLNLQTRTTSH